MVMVREFVVVVLCCCCSVVLGQIVTTPSHHHPQKSSPHRPPWMPTFPPAQDGNITIGPSIKVNYSLELTTSGPAVLDSTITFFAKVWRSPNRTLPNEEFHFRWLNSANQGNNYTKGRNEAKLHMTFHSSNAVKHGKYLMTVIVYPKRDKQELLTFRSTEFILTEHLNGNISVEQDLEYQRKNDTFAVDQDVTFRIHLVDKFTAAGIPEYTYYWYNDSKLIHSSPNPQFVTDFRQPDAFKLSAVATVQLYPPGNHNLLDLEPKFGTFLENIVLKESLSDCNVTRVDSGNDDQSVKLGDSVIINIACNGSSPSGVCWSITGLNETFNETCKPPTEFQNMTHHQVAVPIGQKGWSTVQFAVYNDVSVQLMSQNYYVYDADSVDIPALVFPIVFIVLGISIAAAGGAYIVRLRRRLHVEVADFDFDPNISVRASNFPSSMASRIKQFIVRFKRQRSQRSTPTPSGMNRSASIYESL